MFKADLPVHPIRELIEEYPCFQGWGLLLCIVKQQAPTLKTGIFFYEFPDWMDWEVGFKHVLSTLEICGAKVAHLQIGLVEKTGLNKAGFEFLASGGYEIHIACNENTSILEKILATENITQISTDFLDYAINLRSIYNSF